MPLELPTAAPYSRAAPAGAAAVARRGRRSAMAGKEEKSFVAEAQNWEGRVKAEVDAAKIWYKDWGSLYAPDMPDDYEARIAQLQEKADAIKGGRLQTNNSDYGVGKPFKEFITVKEKKPDLI